MSWALLLILIGLVTGPGVPAEEAGAGAAIFIYHRFGEDRYPSTSVSLEQFEAQLDHLDRAGYAILSLPDLVERLQDGGSLPERAVALTVDDAFRSVYDEAFPRLRERGWPFTVFVSTDPVDEGLAAYMTWDQLREMRDAGVTLANHGARHVSMLDAGEGDSESDRLARARENVERGQRRLREELGEAPLLFAYPYGEYDEALADLVRKMGYVSFGQQSGAAGRLSDPRSYPRFPMAEPFADLAGFRSKAAALPMPVTSIRPWNPVTRERRPSLDVTLSERLPRADELACYVSGQGRVEVEWIETDRRFRVRAERDLPRGRARYNCTAPSGQSGRYHWFSHPWVVQP